MQEFDIKIRDRKGTKNQVADHFSRLESLNLDDQSAIKEKFVDEQLLRVEVVPWYTNLRNYLLSSIILHEFNRQPIKNCLHDVRQFT